MKKPRKGRPLAYEPQMPRVREMIEGGSTDDEIIDETGVPQNKIYEVRRVLKQTNVAPNKPEERAS